MAKVCQLTRTLWNVGHRFGFRSCACIQPQRFTPTAPLPRSFSVSSSLPAMTRDFSKFADAYETQNDIVYPPQKPGEPPRPAFVAHVKRNVKYSPWTLWYICQLVIGRSVEDGIKQLEFVNKKGALFVKQALLEAQEKAVSEHGVEFKTNLWIADLWSYKGFIVRGLRRHRQGKICIVEYFYSNIFVTLEEGAPPDNFHEPRGTPDEKVEQWLANLRNRYITFTH